MGLPRMEMSEVSRTARAMGWLMMVQRGSLGWGRLGGPQSGSKVGAKGTWIQGRWGESRG